MLKVKGSITNNAEFFNPFFVSESLSSPFIKEAPELYKWSETFLFIIKNIS